MKDYEIKEEIRRLEQALIDQTKARVTKGLDATAKALKEIEAEKQYRKAAALYDQLKQAEDVVKAYAAEIEADGLLAEDPAGNTFRLKMLASGTAVTFARVNPGMVLDVSGASHLVKSVDLSYLGNKVELLPLNTKAYVNNEQTPTPGHFNRSTKTLELPRTSPLRSGDVVTILGVKYAPAAIVGPQDISRRYELKGAN
jgi:hypothetical protein